jgi:hypothetical protein
MAAVDRVTANKATAVTRSFAAAPVNREEQIKHRNQ